MTVHPPQRRQRNEALRRSVSHDPRAEPVSVEAQVRAEKEALKDFLYENAIQGIGWYKKTGYDKKVFRYMEESEED